ncbi:hypothetical protein [Xanthobacter autotrophicus]|uniref:hypothetical protein n=1 Tax=Xanthobacter autotrophicus TaxID=280 RepID=UPI003727D50F
MPHFKSTAIWQAKHNLKIRAVPWFADAGRPLDLRKENALPDQIAMQSDQRVLLRFLSRPAFVYEDLCRSGSTHDYFKTDIHLQRATC